MSVHCTKSINNYEKKAVSTVTSDVTISSETINDNTIFNSAKNSAVQINGKIDGFKQNRTRTGDCWLLAGLISMSETSDGANIIKDAISQDKESGNVTVKLKGVNESYTFTPAEIIEAKNRLSVGDDDVRVIELAVEKHREKILKTRTHAKSENLNRHLSTRIGAGTKENPLNGGKSAELYFLLSGKKSTFYRPVNVPFIVKPLLYLLCPYLFAYKSNTNACLSKMQKKPNKYATTVKFCQDKNLMLSDHEYSLKKADSDSVTIINTWDSSEELKINRKEFNDNIMMMESCDMSVK